MTPRLFNRALEPLSPICFCISFCEQNEPLNEKEKSLVIKQLKNRLGFSVDVDIQIVENRPKDKNGKSRLIIGLK